MNVSFIALNISGAEAVQSATDNLRGILSELGRCDFKLCGSMSQVSSSLADAFANTEVVIVGVEPESYCKAKLAILRAMHIKTNLNEELKMLAKAKSGIDSHQLSMHCAMPENAEVFPTDDGLYSGFAVQSGKQYFAMLTLDKHLLNSVVNKGLVPYFKGCGFESKKAEQPAEASAEKSVNGTPAAMKAAEALVKSGNKVYFASTPSCEMLKEACGNGLQDSVFVFSDYSAKRGEESPRSYIADLARFAIPQGENAFGAAVSNIFTGTSSEDGQQKYNVYVALADVSSSRVLRFASQPDETPEQLITAAIDMLFDMISEKCAAPLGVVQTESGFEAEPIELFEEPTPAVTEKKKSSVGRAIAYALLAVVLAFAVFLGFNGYNAAAADRESAQDVFAEYAMGAAVNGGSLFIFEDSYIDEVTQEEATTKEETTKEADSTEPTAMQTSTSALISTTTAKSDNIKPTSAAKTTAKATIKTTVKATEKTTVKPTAKPTVAKTTTTKPTTTKGSSQAVGDYKGKFIFTVYGYGHGVGMSQEGALGYSRNGSTYSEILSHYYPETTLEKSDPSMPEKITFGGVEYSVTEYLCRSVAAEIGGSCNSGNREAIKAQAVAIYTYAKRYGFKIKSSLHAFNKTADFSGTALEAAIKSVEGEYLSYKGQPVMATYYAMSAGKTTKGSTVWSGNVFPYLEQSVESPYDKSCKNYKTTYTVSADELAAVLKKNLGVELSGNPAGWLEIVSHDKAVSSSVGYVTQMKVGDKTVSGAQFRTALSYKIRSHCFTFAYIAD